MIASLKKIGLVLASTTIGLLIAEFCLRIFAGSPIVQSLGVQGYIQPVRFHHTSADAPMADYTLESVYLRTEKGYRHRPNAETWIQRRDGSEVHLQFNEAGLRDRPLSMIPSNATQVLMLGDSITVATDLSEELTFVGLLNQTVPNHHFINAGVAGYGIQDELDLLEDILPLYKPSLVVLNFFLNDAVPSPTIRLFFPPPPLHHSLLLQQIYLTSSLLRREPLGGREARDQRQISQWMHEATARITALPSPFRERALSAVADWGAAWSSAVWDYFEKQLIRFTQLGSKHAFTPAVVILPARDQVELENVDMYPQQRMRNLGEILSLQVIDLLPGMRDLYSSQPEKFFSDQAHLTAKGHATVASILQAQLFQTAGTAKD